MQSNKFEKNGKHKALLQSSSTSTSVAASLLQGTSEANGQSQSPSRTSDPCEKSTTNKKHQRTFAEKEFVIRESCLTTLLEIDHFKTIYNIFTAVFILFALNNIVYDHYVRGSVGFALGTFKVGFAKIHYVLTLWLVQTTFVLSLYYALKIWQYGRCKLSKQKFLQSLWSRLWLTIYITCQLIFIYVPAKFCLKYNLPYVSALVLLLETVRMVMKTHSFVRTISARCLRGKQKYVGDENSTVTVDVPPIGKYVYYLFAPTLLYRDNYPRTSMIRWGYVVGCLLEIVAVAFLYGYIYERHIKHNFEHFGVEKLTAASLTLTLFGLIMPCFIIFLSGFYLLLHVWHNFTAELLRFGDRMFYRDWWTAHNFEAYYRNWNVLVHDWLHEYVYKDLYTTIFRGSKLASTLTVFIISALFHEYVLGYALQVFFPVMFVFFSVPGVFMIFVTRLVSKNVGNTMLWWSLILGYGLMTSLYSMEHFASTNCPKDSSDSWSEALVPHLWRCFNK